MRGRRIRWALLGMALALQAVALYSPGSSGPPLITIPHIDKVVHGALFAVPAYLIRRLTVSWWPVVALAAHAVVSELIQGAWLPNRAGDPFDLLADGVGIGLGVWAATWVNGRSRAGSSRG